MRINDIEIEIRKSFYNKSHVQEDGITHIIDTEHNYPVYQFGMAKNYFDIEDKQDVVRNIVSDLKSVVSELERLLEIEKDKDELER